MKNPVDVMIVDDWLDKNKCDFDNDFKWLLEHRFFQFCYNHARLPSWGRVCRIKINNDIYVRFCIKVDKNEYEDSKKMQYFSARIIDVSLRDLETENHLMSYQMTNEEVNAFEKLSDVSASFGNSPLICIEDLFLKILDMFSNVEFV